MKPVFLPKHLERPTPPELARAWGLTLTDEDDHWVLELPDTWAVNQLGMVRDDKGEMRFRVFADVRRRPSPPPAPPAVAGEGSAVTWMVFPLYRLFEHKTGRVDVVRGRATVKVFAPPQPPRTRAAFKGVKARAEAWMDRIYPEWRNPLAYWGTENRRVHGAVHADFQRVAYTGKR